MLAEGEVDVEGDLLVRIQLLEVLLVVGFGEALVEFDGSRIGGVAGAGAIVALEEFGTDLGFLHGLPAVERGAEEG